MEETDLLLSCLINKNKTESNKRQEGLQFIVSSNNNEPLLKGSISCHNMEELLTPKHFLTDFSIEYYQCLLMREELDRAQRGRTKWKPCYVHTTLFMTVLSNRVGGRKKLGYSFDNAIRNQDRTLIGKCQSQPTITPTEMFHSPAHYSFNQVIISLRSKN